jgi:hypothetical protein
MNGPCQSVPVRMELRGMFAPVVRTGMVKALRSEVGCWKVFTHTSMNARIMLVFVVGTSGAFAADVYTRVAESNARIAENHARMMEQDRQRRAAAQQSADAAIQQQRMNAAIAQGQINAQRQNQVMQEQIDALEFQQGRTRRSLDGNAEFNADLHRSMIERQKLDLEERRVAALERIANQTTSTAPPPLLQRPSVPPVVRESDSSYGIPAAYLLSFVTTPRRAEAEAAREAEGKILTFHRAVWASRARVFSANRTLADPQSVYRKKLNELEESMRADPARSKLFDHYDWPERLFAEFQKRYGEIPPMFR